MNIGDLPGSKKESAGDGIIAPHLILTLALFLFRDPLEKTLHDT